VFVAFGTLASCPRATKGGDILPKAAAAKYLAATPSVLAASAAAESAPESHAWEADLDPVTAVVPQVPGWILAKGGGSGRVLSRYGGRLSCSVA
jgi:hypothetical protein